MLKYILLLLLLTSCGTEVYTSCANGYQNLNGACVIPDPAPSCPSTLAEPSILSKWVETAGSAVISQPDFSAQALNTTGNADTLMGCTGSYGNNIVNNTMTSGQVRLQGTTTEGIIQFGNVKYFGMDYTTRDGLNCKNVSKEMYAYTIRNQVLKLCLTNLSYPYCSTYRLAP